MKVINNKDSQIFENGNKDRVYRILGRVFLGVLILAFAILLTIYIVDKFVPKDVNYMSPEKMTELVNKEDDLDKPYAASYFYDWNFLPIRESKLQSIETVFRDYYLKADLLPSAYEMAKKTLQLFIDNFYDRIDLTNEIAVTDALVSCYVEAVGDPYSIYRTADEYDDYSGDMSGNFVGIGVVIEYDMLENKLTVSELVEDSGAMIAGILPGDIIIGVDDIFLEDVGYIEFSESLSGQAGTIVKITVIRDGQTISFDVERKKLVERTVKYEILDGGIGYVRITSFKRNTAAQFRDAIDALEAARVRGIIYDLRGNLGGYVESVEDILSYIVPEGTPITSYSNKYTSSSEADSSHTFLIPSIVLCNGRTASGAELFTAAMRDYNTMGLLDVTLIGEKTYGKGVIQDSLAYTDGSAITLTVAYYYPPLGEEYGYDGVGIMPDIVLPREDGEGDNQLERALLEMDLMLKQI